jgi:predicted MFS family arabinose efflux permease
MKIFQRRGYILFILAAVYALSVLDRQILAILLQPIKLDLGLSDGRLGFITGIAFAIFYTFLGIPLARVADLWNRKNLIAIALSVFSIMTALCSTATNFWHLLLMRIGVGIGEAGATPASISTIADLYPERSRGTATALFTVGGVMGTFLGFAAGGIIAQAWGWRAAFAAVGFPGLALAMLVVFTGTEPPREIATGGTPTLAQVLPFLWRQRAFRHLTCGVALLLFFGHGFQTWLPAYFQRSHGMSLAQIGVTLGILIGGLSAVGILASGLLSDRLSSSDVRWRSWIVAIAICVTLPFYVTTLLAQDKILALASYAVPALLSIFYQAPALSLLQGLAPAQMRAVAVAIVLFVVNLVGIGLGPQLVGIVSDALQPRFGGESLRYALLVASPVLLWSAAHFYWAGRHLPDDLARVHLTAAGSATLDPSRAHLA